MARFSTSDTTDRRQHPRIEAGLGVKILRPAVARYIAAITQDVSKGGALLEVRTARPISEGEDLSIGVCWTSGPLLRADELVTATVVRADPVLSGAQKVAVKFAQTQQKADDLAQRLSAAEAA